MRIALVTEFYYPHLGGVTEHVHYLAREFRRRGHSTTILTSHMGPSRAADGAVWEDDPWVKRLGRSVVLLSNGSFARITVGWGLGRKVRDFLREGAYDIVHVHGALAPTFGIVVPEEAYRLGIPVVGTFHSWFRRSVACGVLRRPLQRRLDRIDVKIAVSEPVVWAMSRYFRADWEIIPNGVCTDTFQPNGRRPVDPDVLDPRLLFLGRLDPRNGLETVLDAMPAILKRYPRAQLTVAGDGPLRPAYERRARRLAGKVRFVGRVHEERPECYATSDLYVCPASKASFGITLLESMACGTPMIVSDIIGFRELIDGGEEAVLVEPKDAGAWADAAIRLLGDPARRAAMGMAGLRKAARFSWSAVADRVLESYGRVLR